MEIANESERLDMKNKAPLLLVELLCDQNMREQVKTYRIHFQRVRTSFACLHVFVLSYISLNILLSKGKIRSCKYTNR